jgi:hypothetical protein
MGRTNAAFLSFNRGILSPRALARVDLDRTRLSSEIQNNWIAKTAGAMTIRPGTKYFGSSLRDTGAEFIEFVASTDDVALLELTDDKMRIWLGDDAHNLALLSRPKVDTTVSLADTGWSNTSIGGSTQVDSDSGHIRFQTTAFGSLSRAEKRVIVSDTGTEHSLAFYVRRGPVVLRCGSTQRADDYIAETSLGTGYHNLAFTPTGNFWITLQSDDFPSRIVESLAIGDSGTVEITTPWGANDLANVRYDQSADVIYVDCDGVRPQKIERRGTGRSWSVVDYVPNNGPFLPATTSSARLTFSARVGDITITADRPVFQAGHVGSLIRAYGNGQNGSWGLGNVNAATPPISVTGVSDTGTPSANNERRLVFTVGGTYVGTVTVERSIDGDDIGFKTVSNDIVATPTDTGTLTFTIDDPSDNLEVWYRIKMTAYTSGFAIVSAVYGSGGRTGVVRITDYTSSTSVLGEVLSQISSEITDVENWQESYWSGVRGYPTAVALHGGRLAHAQGGSVFLSVSDDYENFDDTVEGDAGPIIRTLGSGPVDAIRFLVSLLRLIIGTSGAELTARSSSLDEPLTPDNSSAAAFGTQGSANMRAVKMDNRAIFVQRSGQRVFMVGAGTQGSTFGDYESYELTLLVPDLLEAGVVSIAIQRQPDTRLHCVLTDGTVAILTYEPQEEVICWTTWETDGYVEKAVALPGVTEDAVYYHVRRTINGATKRYVEKLALETECFGDTGLNWLMDCAKSYTDTGRTTTLTDVATHLVGQSVIAWGSLDTGSTPHVDLSPDVNGVQTTYTVDTGGDVVLTGLTEGVHHAVVGLPYHATWKSTKLSYGAEAGTALNQVKRPAQIGFVLYKTHNRGIEFGSDTGRLDPLPKMIEGAVVDPDQIFETFDQIAVSMESTHNPDARIFLRAKAPRPCTVLAAVPSVQTNERV